MPGSASEAITNEKDTDEDGDCESDHGSDSTDRENRTDRHGTTEDEEEEEDADDGVEPHGVDWRVGVFVNSFNPRGEGEAVVACVGECYSRCGDHATLTHEEAANDGDG